MQYQNYQIIIVHQIIIELESCDDTNNYKIDYVKPTSSFHIFPLFYSIHADHIQVLTILLNAFYPR